MKPVVGLVGSPAVELPEYEATPYRPGGSYDAILLARGELRPEGLPEWVPSVEDPKALRRSIRRWAITIEETQEIRGPGTVVFGALSNARLRLGENAVREGHERSMRIREIRVEGRTVQEATPGQKVALAFGPVPPEIFRSGGVLRPGKGPKAEPKAPPNTELKQAVLDAVGDGPDGRGTAAVLKTLGKTPQQLGDVFEALRREGRLYGFAGQWIKPRAFDEGVDHLIAALDSLHSKNPGQPSQPVKKAVAAARLGWSGKPLDRILARLVEKGAVSMREDEIRRPSFRVKLGDRQRTMLDRVTALIDEGGTNPPNAHEIGKRLPAPRQAVDEVLQLGEDVGEIVTLADGVLFTAKGLQGVKDRIRQGSGGKPFTLGDMRDALGTNRRVAVALLEYLDAAGFTQRDGERRVVRG